MQAGPARAGLPELEWVRVWAGNCLPFVWIGTKNGFIWYFCVLSRRVGVTRSGDKRRGLGTHPGTFRFQRYHGEGVESEIHRG